MVSNELANKKTPVVCEELARDTLVQGCHSRTYTVAMASGVTGSATSASVMSWRTSFTKRRDRLR